MGYHQARADHSESGEADAGDRAGEDGVSAQGTVVRRDRVVARAPESEAEADIGTTNPYDKVVYLTSGGAPTALSLGRIAPNVYRFASTQFYPIDGLGWNANPPPQVDNDCGGSPEHNFSFTSELHYAFTYRAGTSQSVTFTGDDDAWAFINGHLAIDLGGTHGPLSGSVTLDAATAALGLIDGGTYALDFFQAARHTCASNYTLTLNGFVSNTVSQCSPQ